jgi:dienelactone hydrolase
MRAGGVDWQLHLYGGVVHSFTDPAADARGAPTMLRYDRKADERSWATLGLFLDEVFA